MHLPSRNHDENAWEFCFVHMVEVQGQFESRCRKSCASPTIGRNEKGEQAAEDSNGGSTLLIGSAGNDSIYSCVDIDFEEFVMKISNQVVATGPKGKKQA
jgi:hypothetical protein